MKNPLYRWFITIGIILVAVFNPLAVNLWADALVVAINFLTDQLIEVSNYTLAIGGTLLVVGFLSWHGERGKKETKRLKKLSSKKNKKSPKYLDL